jgi:2-keto-4-pentenoate hydratase/2-oxohepta-3-ene-1,7-dioic acid hydratase in catechol pathway
MKLARVRDGSQEWVAVILREQAILLEGVRSVVDLLKHRDTLARMEEVVARMESIPAGGDLKAEGQVRPLREVTLLAPIPRPPKIVALGRNYAAHAREMGNVPSEEPPIFFKPPSSAIGPGEPILLPPESEEVHHEIEIGVVIAARGVRVPADRAYELVGGYMVLNDVTARDIQRQDIRRSQPFDRAKSFDTFCPMGPFVVTKESLPDPERLRLVLRVNGEVRQDASTADMILSIPRTIAYITRYMSLEPGDVIATGTPEGVGPLRAGDVVEAEIEGIGVLRNPVVALES